MYKSRRHPICIWVTKFYEHKQFQQDVLIIQSQIFTFMQYAIQAIGYLINSLHRHNTSIFMYRRVHRIFPRGGVRFNKILLYAREARIK